jgi:hypothetical protein
MDCDERPEDTEQQGMYTRVGVNNSLYIFFNAHARACFLGSAYVRICSSLLV